jgi:hypothetical protein
MTMIDTDVDVTETDKAEGAASRVGGHDRRMVRQVARVISGMSKDQWKEADREAQKAHLLTARRVLNTIERIRSRQDAQSGEAGLDDDDA